MKYLPIMLLLILGLIISGWFFPAHAAKDLPDVYIYKIEIVPYQGTEFKDGEKALIECTVKRGNIPVNAFHVAFYHGDKFIKEIRIKPAQFTSGVFTLQAGIKYDKNIIRYTCVADSRNVINESNEENNRQEKSYIPVTYIDPNSVTTVQIEQKSDIAITGMLISNNPSGYAYCFYHYIGKNPQPKWKARLNIKYENGFDFPFYGDASGEEYGYVAFSTFSFLNPEVSHGKATCHLDYTNSIDELDENNNTAVFDKNKNKIPSALYHINKIVEPKVLPDIQAADLKFERDIHITQVNGLWGIPKGTFKCYWKYIGDPVATEWMIWMVVRGELIGTKTIRLADMIKGAGVAVFSYKGYWDDNLKAKIPYRCELDYGNRVKEKNEDNNVINREY